MEGKSEAQIKNEQEVRRRMAELGYVSAPKSVSGPPKDKPRHKGLSGLLVLLVIVAISTATIFYYANNSESDANSNDSRQTVQNITADTTKETKKPTQKKQTTEKEQDKFTTKKETQVPQSNNQQTPSSTHDDIDEGRHAVDLHHCDSLEEKYNQAVAEKERLGTIYDNAYKSQHSYSELYEQAGHNPTVAKQLMQAEQNAVKKAFKDYQDAMNTANSIYNDEILPCKREMYNIH